MKKMRNLLFMALTLVMFITFTGCKSGDYNKAIKLQEEGKYTEAIAIYKGIEDYENYKDTTEKIAECSSMVIAINKYETAKKSAEDQNSELTIAVKKAEDLIDKKEKCLDETLIQKLETAISNLKSVKKEIPDMPATENEILEVVEALNSIDYTKELVSLEFAHSELQKSIDQYALVNAPTEEYVIKCLNKVDKIKGVSAVTEDNDPNGNLNKAGGYTSTVYFSDSRINLDSSIYGNTIIEQGTDGGGSIEVYANEEDAIKRDEYLANFDGGIFASGSHKVVGTVLVRTSNELTASQQNELEKDIIDALTFVEE